ncbi:hypothetical protein [Paenibacillus vortex]|uniref:hypothetical protein n=1 Tax=Paenibacillus vortex TaxID=71995 RepID=UPI00135F118C|nr:hypothetical protein [Paenibacillus vortex]
MDQIINDINSYAQKRGKKKIVEGQEHGPIEVAISAAFFILSVQVLVPSQGQELVPIAEKDKNMSRLPIR